MSGGGYRVDYVRGGGALGALPPWSGVPCLIVEGGLKVAPPQAVEPLGGSPE